MTTQVLVDDRILTDGPDGPRLIGGRCSSCGTYSFPQAGGCAKCTSSECERVELGTRGTLWTYTVQGFPPKAPPYIGDVSPEGFVPYGVGYVELPGQVKVEARLTESDPERLRIGMDLELCLVPLGPDAQGRTVMTFAFRPVG